MGNLWGPMGNEYARLLLEKGPGISRGDCRVLGSLAWEGRHPEGWVCVEEEQAGDTASWNCEEGC